MRDSVGVVAILFTDLVGSTEVLDRLGDDAAEELRRTLSTPGPGSSLLRSPRPTARSWPIKFGKRLRG
jgi:hypothetical protein